jgi:hypothetical protein
VDVDLLLRPVQAHLELDLGALVVGQRLHAPDRVAVVHGQDLDTLGGVAAALVAVVVPQHDEEDYCRDDHRRQHAESRSP